MSIEIIKPGICTTIQDGGRVGVQEFGIPVSGFMDKDAAQLANILVNNKPNATLIETTLVGCVFKNLKAITIAITGADMSATINGQIATTNKALIIPKNSIISLSVAKNGVYGYIAFSGGIITQSDYESTATYLPAKLGGNHGKQLCFKDIISTGKALKIKNACVKKYRYKQDICLACLPGPEWACFSEKSKEMFFKNTYKISKNSNRIGIRLEGPVLTMPKKSEIISSGIVKGTVQITKEGIPIVMMADAPTTGGYLRLINLTEKACNQLAQIQIGGTLKFKI